MSLLPFPGSLVIRPQAQHLLPGIGTFQLFTSRFLQTLTPASVLVTEFSGATDSCPSSEKFQDQNILRPS